MAARTSRPCVFLYRMSHLVVVVQRVRLRGHEQQMVDTFQTRITSAPLAPAADAGNVAVRFSQHHAQAFRLRRLMRPHFA